MKRKEDGEEEEWEGMYLKGDGRVDIFICMCRCVYIYIGSDVFVYVLI